MVLFNLSVCNAALHVQKGKLQRKHDVWRYVIATSRTIWRKRHWWLPSSAQILRHMEIRITLFSTHLRRLRYLHCFIFHSCGDQF